MKAATGDDAETRGRCQPSLVQALALAVAVAFLASTITALWITRDGRPNATDVGFYDDMIAHHFQALAMAGVYQRYGDDPVLRMIGGEINLHQAGDIRQMQSALRDWNKAGTPDIAMEWMAMPVPQQAQPGMASKAQMAALEAARGRRLDDLFSRLMLNHHEAGKEMAQAAISRARLGSVRRLAAIMVRDQRYEIADLKLRRSQLGLANYSPPTYMSM